MVAVAIDKDKGSQAALKWAVDHLLGKGKSVTLIHVKLKTSFPRIICSLSLSLACEHCLCSLSFSVLDQLSLSYMDQWEVSQTMKRPRNSSFLSAASAPAKT